MLNKQTDKNRMEAVQSIRKELFFKLILLGLEMKVRGKDESKEVKTSEWITTGNSSIF